MGSHSKRILCSFSILLLFLIGNGFTLSGCSAHNPPKFDSLKAFDLLKKQCDFGPRPLGTKAHERTRDYLYDQLKPYATSVVLQNFEHTRDGTKYKLSNIIAQFGDDRAGSGILLCAHWDTRPTADEELEERDRKKPILGANDGASGVAVLLEIARMLHERPASVPVTIVLFDGEDFGPGGDDMFLGSRYFAANIGDKSSFRYGILLDMVGDKELELYRERFSQDGAREVVDRVWSTAKELGYAGTFKDKVKYKIGDDHLPLIKAGVPCIDVIDFDYAYWHTLKDTVDKCSPESLRIVGETVAYVVYSEQPRP